MSEPDKRKWDPAGMKYPRRVPVYDTQDGINLLQSIADRWQVSKAAAIRRMVRETARREGMMSGDLERIDREIRLAIAEDCRAVIRCAEQRLREGGQMQMNTDPEWLKRMAELEDGQEVAAGGRVPEFLLTAALARAEAAEARDAGLRAALEWLRSQMAGSQCSNQICDGFIGRLLAKVDLALAAATEKPAGTSGGGRV